MSSAAASAPRDSHHVGLDREAVVACATALVETGGPAALTMRKLAGELGVTPTTLYWHVGSRDDIVAAIVEQQGTLQADRPIVGDTARERVLDAARHVWRSALDHRQITRLAHQTGSMAMLELGLEQALVRELDAAGLRGEQARDALRSILLCVGGFLVLALRDPEAVDDERSSTRLWATVSDEAIHPETVQALTEPVDLDTLLDTTLGVVVDHWVPAG